MSDTIYLDHNATAPMRACASDILVRLLGETGNASSVHGAGRRARAHVEMAREQVARAVGARPAEVIFTGSGTEANNLALRGAPRTRVLTSAVEHPSVLEAVTAPIIVPVDTNGRVDLNALDKALQDGGEPALVSVMSANNETGVLQPVEAVVEIARQHGALVHTDAIQAAGKVAVNFAEWDVDMMSISAHKLGGPQGVGALIVREGLEVSSILRGGGQERRHRAGTENVAGLAAFGAAIEEASANLDEYASVAQLRDELEAKIASVAADAVFFGQDALRLPNTSCFAVAGLPSETQVISLDLANVMVSAGSACSSGKVEPSHVLTAMGGGEDLASSAIRVSLGWQSSRADIDRFVDVWADLFNRAVATPAAGRAA